MTGMAQAGRLWGLAVAPAAALCLVCYAALLGHAWLLLERQAKAYGDAVTLPLAELFAEHALEGDALALTVLARSMQAGTPIATVEIYGLNRQLLAQVGEAPGDYAFTRQLSYRNSAVGHLTISLDAPPGGLSLLALLPLLLAGGMAGGLWLYRARALGWATEAAPASGRAATGQAADGQGEQDEEETGDICLLACRIWPAQAARRYRASFMEAVRLSHGKPEMADRELTASFQKPEDAAAAALLLRSLVAESGASLKCGAALGASAEDAAGARKRLSHIASLAEGCIVTDRGLASSIAHRGHLLQDFQHSLMDTENLVQLAEPEPTPAREALAKALLESHRLAQPAS